MLKRTMILLSLLGLAYYAGYLRITPANFNHMILQGGIIDAVKGDVVDALET